ncbi:MAG: hypothetical protein ACSHYF_17990 [Verrucomicrobiaceae bacterium]
MKIKHYSILALASFLTLASCSEEKDASNTPSSNEDGSLSSLVLKDEPKEATDIASLRKSAKPGDKVTFSGDILGSMDVFMDNRAVMILGDPKKLTACNLIPGDECPTPWDVCCDDPDVITASIVTVQAVDDAGKPLKEGFKGVAGIKELSSLVVTGEVAQGSTDTNMLVNATGIFVKN